MTRWETGCARIFRSLIESWLKIGLEDESVDSSADPAAIGYCFGGVAFSRRSGRIRSSGVVSFHGLCKQGRILIPHILGSPYLCCDNHYNKNRGLIENGAEISWCRPERKVFKEMDEAGVDWVSSSRQNTSWFCVAFFGSTRETYEPADRRSTQICLLFREIFPEVTQNAVSKMRLGRLSLRVLNHPRIGCVLLLGYLWLPRQSLTSLIGVLSNIARLLWASISRYLDPKSIDKEGNYENWSVCDVHVAHSEYTNDYGFRASRRRYRFGLIWLGSMLSYSMKWVPSSPDGKIPVPEGGGLLETVATFGVLTSYHQIETWYRNSFGASEKSDIYGQRICDLRLLD